MKKYYRNHMGVLSVLIVLAGLGLAFAIPWLASGQSLVAKNESFGDDITLETPPIYYVAITGTGSPGTSWAGAFKNVQDALASVEAPAEIRVAKGVYYPDTGGGNMDNDPNSTFVMTNRVALYGGFRFGDKNFSDRNWEVNLTVLSGDIDGDDKHAHGVVMTTTDIISQNAYHVVTASGVSESAILDGFTITAGQANGVDPIEKGGGGILCDVDTSICNPSLKNLKFTGNYAEYEGGAMFIYCENGTCSPSMTNAVVSNCSAGNGGGGISVDCSDCTFDPNLSKISFLGNDSKKYGGAMMIYCYRGACHPSLSNVTFSGNFSKRDSGAIDYWCEDSICSPSFRGVVFSENSTGDDDGAMRYDCYNSTCSPTIVDSVISGNTAVGDGGGIRFYCEGGKLNPSLRETLFSGNLANEEDGGALRILYYGCSGSASLTNVVFSGNSAKLNGGGMHNFSDGSSHYRLTLTNVTFSGNYAGRYGGALYNDSSFPQLRNSILWNNKDNSGTGTINATIFLSGSAVTTLTHSLVEGASKSGVTWIGGDYVDGGGNIDDNPEFIESIDPTIAPTTNGILRLQSSSPAIDKGNNAYLAGVIKDLDGQPRIFDGDKDGTATADMGAYEYIEYTHEGYLPLIIR